MSEIRKTTQYLIPVDKTASAAGEYDIYPVHSLGDGTVFAGFDELAKRISGCRTVVVDGYVGVRFDDFVSRLNEALVAAGVKALWWSVEAAMKSSEEIDRLIEPYLGADDPIFGFRSDLSLSDFLMETSFSPSSLTRRRNSISFMVRERLLPVGMAHWFIWTSLRTRYSSDRGREACGILVRIVLNLPRKCTNASTLLTG